MTTRAAMDENTFLRFYKESVLGYSKKAQRKICKRLLDDGRITFDAEMCSPLEGEEPIHFEKNDPELILSTTTMSRDFMGFFEWWEYVKLYKYSVPVFFKTRKSMRDILGASRFNKFEKDAFTTDYILRTSLQDAEPMWFESEGKYFIKFVLQKSWFRNEEYEQIDYRYPIIIYIDENTGIVEVRYDAIKYYYQQMENDVYADMVSFCLKWITDNLGLELFSCNHLNTIDVINDKTDSSVRMYRQMMDLKSGASAELKAGEGRDAVLPFVGELRELINENEKLFSKADEIRELLVKYLNDIEATARYPYIYIKWENAVESQSFIVKITFDYLSQKYTLLQHLTGTCNDMEMERMNNAIKYLCESGAFVEGEQIKY